MSSDFLTVLYLSIATGAISMTVAKAKIFAPVRAFVTQHTAFIGGGLSCPYCVSHWVAFFFVCLYRPYLVHGYFVVDFVVSMMVIVALASATSWVIFHAFASMAE